MICFAPVSCIKILQYYYVLHDRNRIDKRSIDNFFQGHIEPARLGSVLSRFGQKKQVKRNRGKMMQFGSGSFFFFYFEPKSPRPRED